MRRNDAASESQPRDLRQALIQMTHRSDLSGQTDFANCCQITANRQILVTRRDRKDDRQIRCRLVQTQAADDVDVCIAARQRKSRTLFQHSQQQHRAVVVDAIGVAPRAAVARRRDQRLHLSKHRARALHDADNARARCIARPPG